MDEDGFMNIEDLVDFLKRESGMDICVIKASGDRRSYVEYFVIVSGNKTSASHGQEPRATGK